MLGTRDYATLDLTSPDAVMDAVGNAVEDVAEELLGEARRGARRRKLLIGLDPPPGHPTVPTISLADLLGDPLGAVAGYWQTLLTDHADAVPAVLLVLRDAIADAGAVVGRSAAPGRRPTRGGSRSIGPLELEAHADGDVLTIALAAGTSVDTLGQRCTVVETRLAATLAEIDLGARTASAAPAVDGRLTARERGVTPPRVTLVLGDGVGPRRPTTSACGSWAAAAGSRRRFEAPADAAASATTRSPSPCR